MFAAALALPGALPGALLSGCGGGADGDAVRIAPVTPAGVPAAAAADPAPPRPLTVIAVGDLMFAREVVTLTEEHGLDYPFARVARELGGGDLLIGNLEGTFTERGEALPKFYTFRAPPAVAGALRGAGFDAVGLANNHAFDFGAVGLADTQAALAAVGVAAVGAGDDAAAAHAPLLLDRDGRRVALLAYDDIPETQAAAADRPGVAWAEVDTVAREVRAARAAADHVLVLLHAGVEYAPAPTARQRELAAAAIAAGADAVLGHHPHVLQPWERIGDGVVFYSLGNFVFDLDPGDRAALGDGPFLTVAAVLTLFPDRPPEVAVRPVAIDERENRPRPATAAEAEAIRKRLGPGTVFDAGFAAGAAAAAGEERGATARPR